MLIRRAALARAFSFREDDADHSEKMREAAVACGSNRKKLRAG